jgi:hypothetical protein
MAATKKTSQLIEGAALTGPEMLHVVQDGKSRRSSINAIVTKVQDVLSATFSGITDSLSLKVDKVAGKGLSTEDYSTDEKSKLAGIQAGAQVNPDLSPYALNSTVDTKVDAAFVASQIAALVDSSPGVLDTLNELAAALGDDPNFATTVMAAIGEKQTALGFTPENVANKQSDLTPSATKYPVVDAVLAGLSLKADLLLANFTQLQLAGNEVAGYTKGSNASGKWWKFWDKNGVLQMVIQTGIAREYAYGEAIYFPVSFPDTDYMPFGAQYYGRRTFTFERHSAAYMVTYSWIDTGAGSAGYIYPVAIWIKP